MGFLLGLIPGKWVMAAIAAAALAGLLGVQTWRLHSAEAHVAEARAQAVKLQGQWDAARAAAAEAAAAAAAKYQALSAEMQRTKEEAQHALQVSRQNNARVVADLTARHDRELRQLSDYAAGGRGPADDSVAACRDRAEALGSVLGEALRVEAELAGDAENEATNARGLLAAWPREVK